MGLTGDLSKLKMGDLFQTLEGSRQVGVLKVWREGESRELFFGPQGVSLLHLATLCTDRLAERFRNAGEISAEDIASAKRHAETHGSTFGQVLAQRNLVSSEAVEEAVQEQAEELLYDMFGWTQGNFEFFDDKKPDAATIGPYVIDPLPIGPMLLEGARRIDEWGEIKRQVPDRGEVFVAAPLSAAERADLEDDEQLVIEAIDGKTDLRVLADRTLGSLFDTAKVVAALADRELVRLATLDELVSNAEIEFAQGRRENARALLDLAVDRRAPRLRRNLDQIARLYESMEEKERACDLRSYVAGQMIATECYEDARELLQQILELCPEHLNSNKRLMQVLDEIERDSAAAFAQRVRVVELLSSQRETENEARQYSGMLTAAPPRDAVLVRRAANAAMKAGTKDVALNLLHFAANVDREGGQRQRLIETYREILKLDRGNKEIAQALRQILISQQARRRRRALVTAAILLGVGASCLWLTAAWNESNAAALLQEAEELGRRDAQAALLALNQLDESYSGSMGAGEVIEAAARARQGYQRRLADEQRRKDEDSQRLLSSRLTEAGAHIDASRYQEAFPIYRELLAQTLSKGEQETIRFRIQSAIEALTQWDTRMQELLQRASPEHIARLSSKEIEALRAELVAELQRVNAASMGGLRDGLTDPAIAKLLPKQRNLLDEALFTRVGMQQVQGELLAEELGKRIEAYSRTDELENLLEEASKAERENRWGAAAELYRLLAQSSVESGLQAQFVTQAERLEKIVGQLRAIAKATEQRDFAAAVTAYQSLVEEAPDLDLRGHVRLPFLLRSIPSGAEVREGTQVLGLTPLPVEYDPFRAATLIVKSEGFEREVIQVTGFERGDATLVLRTPPLWRVPGHGPVASAPMLQGERCFVADRGGHLRALDLAQRKVIFDRVVTAEMGGLRAAPFACEKGIGVASWEGRLFELDPRDGDPRELGRLPAEGQWLGPIYTDGLVWLSRGSELLHRALDRSAAESARRGLDHPIVRLHALPKGALVGLQGGRVERHGAASTRALWSSETRLTILHLVSSGDAAWIFGADGSIVRLDLESGSERARWKIASAPAQESTYAAGRLYIPMAKEVLCLDAADGRELLRWSLEGLQVTAAPAVDLERARLFVATDKGLEVLDLEKPRTAWRHATASALTAAPLLTPHGVLVALGDGGLELLPRR
ncbi:MAG: DUF4388 domain-containing protein [Planctomycetes bacterium]|nr:DUF4388 domain-containing protein [Planctomycetota bacterium]